MLRTLLVNIEKDSRPTINDVSLHHAISCAVVRVVSCYDAKQVINYRLHNSVKSILDYKASKITQSENPPEIVLPNMTGT